MASFKDGHQSALENGGFVGSSEGLVVCSCVTSNQLGGTDSKFVKDYKEMEATHNGGYLELDCMKANDDCSDKVSRGSVDGHIFFIVNCIHLTLFALSSSLVNCLICSHVIRWRIGVRTRVF